MITRKKFMSSSAEHLNKITAFKSSSLSLLIDFKDFLLVVQ